MDGERPKSSAFTIRRRCGTFSSAITGRDSTGQETNPFAQDKSNLVRFVQASGMRAKDIESATLEFAQEPPIDGAHQLGSHHGASVFAGQQFPSAAIMATRTDGHRFGERSKACG